jgi:hypothetical protein
MTRCYQFGFVATLFSVGLLVGCNSSSSEPAGTSPPGGQASDAAVEHADSHDVAPTAEEIDQLRQETSTWPSAIARIESYRDSIRTETTGGAPAKAHRPLDMLDNVLQWLPQIAQSSEVPKADWQTVGENAQQLRDLFNQVHANIDAGTAPDYASVADAIDKAVAELAAIQPDASRE